MAEIFNIYCDESCYLENDQKKIMVIGAVWLKKDVAAEAAKRLREIKQKHSLAKDFEVKWTKISKSKLEFYEDYLDYFFDDDDFMGPGYLKKINEIFSKNPSCKMVTVSMDANVGRTSLRYATPCCAMKREYVAPTWRNQGQLQDQRYYRSIIRHNKWREGTDIIHIDKVLVFVGHSNKGGLRHPAGDF